MVMHETCKMTSKFCFRTFTRLFVYFLVIQYGFLMVC
jgi:hypothetical protein